MIKQHNMSGQQAQHSGYHNRVVSPLHLNHHLCRQAPKILQLHPEPNHQNSNDISVKERPFPKSVQNDQDLLPPDIAHPRLIQYPAQSHQNKLNIRPYKTSTL
jgi:hypothetical protein